MFTASCESVSLSCATLLCTEIVDCLGSANSRFISLTTAFATTKLFDCARFRVALVDAQVVCV